MKARIRGVRWEAEDVLSFRLEPVPAEHFPAFTAGSHIEVKLRSGLSRSYSLLNDPAEQHAYEIAVQLDPASRGGSRHIHEHWRPGHVVELSAPRNNFPLREDAAMTVLVGGGIGITPMLSMIARLDRIGRPWQLHYAVRTRTRASFLHKLEQYKNVQITIDDDVSTPRLNLERVLASAPDDAHVYCCGPAGMLDAFRLHGAGLSDRMHFEYFASTNEASRAGGYRLQLHGSGKVIQVKPGATMLDALLDAGVDVDYSCTEGICGSCVVSVLDGEPDHRDQYLTDAEKAANRAVMVCCSGALTPSLTLDL